MYQGQCCPGPWRASQAADQLLRVRPALSAMMVGSCRSARANALYTALDTSSNNNTTEANNKTVTHSTASCFLPSVRAASSSTDFAMSASEQPPPYTMRVSVATVCDSTHRASCSERSASSSTCSPGPRSTTVQAAAFGTPLK